MGKVAAVSDVKLWLAGRSVQPPGECGGRAWRPNSPADESAIENTAGT